MTNEIQIFQNDEFGEIRTVERDGNVLFCGKDVAVALGYTNPAKAVRDHTRGERIVIPLETTGGTQQVQFITEGDLYRLVASSKLESAQRFESWVFDEVLPAIRKHGAYMTPVTIDKIVADPAFGIRLLTELQTERERRAELQAENEEMRPKARFAEAVEASHTSILVGDYAKNLRQNGVNIGQNRLFAWLRDNGYLMKQGNSKNMPTQRSMDLKLFEVKERTIDNPDGSVRITRTTKMTGKGQVYFLDKFVGAQSD